MARNVTGIWRLLYTVPSFGIPSQHLPLRSTYNQPFEDRSLSSCCRKSPALVRVVRLNTRLCLPIQSQLPAMGIFTDLVKDSKLKTQYRDGITRHVIETSDRRHGYRKIKKDQR